MGPDRGFGPGFLTQGSPGPIRQPPGASRRQSKLPCAPTARGGEFRLVVTDCERGESPLSHFPPNSPAANGVRCHLFFSRTRQYATTLEARGRRGAPVSDRHRAGARNPHQRPRATPISRLERRSPTASRGSARTCTDDAPNSPAANGVRCHLFFSRTRQSPPRLKRGDGVERRSPTGIARERETCTDDAAPRQSRRSPGFHHRNCTATPRPESHPGEPTHRQPRRITGT